MPSIQGWRFTNEEVADIKKDRDLEILEFTVDTDLGPAVLVRSIERAR
jgi:hypothetical protein